MIRVPTAPRLFDPARDAARLLGWVGIGVLMVAAPLAGVLSRRSLFVLLPVGAGLLICASVLVLSGAGLKAFRRAMMTPLGLTATFFLCWIGLSLVWTPFPGDIAPTYLGSLATILFTSLIISHLPSRPLSRGLYLLPAGVGATALATLAMAAFAGNAFRGGSEFDPSLLERSVLTLAMLVWPALGALGAFRRWGLAIALVLIVAVTIVAAKAPIVMTVFGFGALAFALAMDSAAPLARTAGAIFAALLIIAPSLPFILAPLAAVVPGVGRSTIAAMNDWRDLVLGDGLRLLTGHGLGTASQGVGVWLPAHTPRTNLFEVWYETGVLGAVSLAAVLVLAFEAVLRTTRSAVPALLSGMIVTVLIALFGLATAQLWFVALASLQALASGLLVRSVPPSARPTWARVQPFSPVEESFSPTPSTTFGRPPNF